MSVLIKNLRHPNHRWRFRRELLKEIPLIGMRRVIAENMSRSMREAPHMTMQIDVQMDAAEALEVANEKINDKNSGSLQRP